MIQKITDSNLDGHGSRKQSIEISVIIAAYQQMGSLGWLLSSLAAQDVQKAFEVIVCDDGSDPDVLPLCRKGARPLGLDVRYVWQPHEGHRVSRSRNNGVRCAQGRLLIFLDGDVVVKPDFLRRHLAYHVNPYRVVGGYRSWVLVDPSWNLGEETEIGTLLNKLKQHSRAVDRAIQQTWAQSSISWMACLGCNLSVRSSASIYFDENFEGWGGEDREFVCRLANRHGYEIVYGDDIEVFHLEYDIPGRRPFDSIRLCGHDEIVKYIRNKLYFASLYPDLDLSVSMRGLLRCQLNTSEDRWRIVSWSEAHQDLKQAIRNADAWLRRHNLWIDPT